MTYSVSFSIKDISCDVITNSRLHACMFNISNVRSVDFEIVAESEMETIFKHKDTIRLPPTEIPPRTNFRSDSFKIGIMGDSQAETTRFRQQLEAMRMHDLNLFVRTLNTHTFPSNALEHKTQVHLGDVVQDDSSMFEWYLNFFRPVSSKIGTTPMLYSRGNHDVDGVVKRRRFFSEHPVSTISPNGYFALTASGIRFVVLDTASPYDSRQKDWLECEVSSSDWINAKYRVVLTHIPPFIEYWNPNTWKNGEHRWGYFNRSIRSDSRESWNGHYVFGTLARVSTWKTRLECVRYSWGRWCDVGDTRGKLCSCGGLNMYDKTYFGHHTILSVVQEISGESRLVVQTYSIENVLVDLFVVDESES